MSHGFKLMSKIGAEESSLLSAFFPMVKNHHVFPVGWRTKYLIGMGLLIMFLMVLTIGHLLSLRNQINQEILSQYAQFLGHADALLLSRIDRMALSLQQIEPALHDDVKMKSIVSPRVFWASEIRQRRTPAGSLSQEEQTNDKTSELPADFIFRLQGRNEIVGCYIKLKSYESGQMALIGLRNDPSLGVAHSARLKSGRSGYYISLPKNYELLLEDLNHIKPDEFKIKSFISDFESCGVQEHLHRRSTESTWYGLYSKISAFDRVSSLPVWIDFEIRPDKDAADLWVQELWLCTLGVTGILFSMILLLFRLEKWVEAWNLNIYKIKQEQDFLKIAQRLANVGSFQLYMKSGRMIWSDHMYEILDLDKHDSGHEPTPDLLYAKVHPDDLAEVKAYFSMLGRVAESTEFDKKIEFRWVADKGKLKYLVASALYGSRESFPSGWVCGILQDVTESRNIRDEIYKLATTDSLTGLPNRTSLTTRVEEMLVEARSKQSMLAFVYLDLDNFKDVNDAFGHSFGDVLLLEMAARLKSRLLNDDFLCRQGGDEFLIILKNAEPEAVHLQAEVLLAISVEPFLIMGREISVSFSMGIAMFPDDGEYYDTIQRKADIAMYEAKRSGRNNYVFYSPSIRHQSERNIFIVNSFRKALESDQFYLEYQPIISTSSGRVVSFEVLLRWRHPELGSISPAEFIPLAEQSGFILQLGHWTLRQAVIQLKRWLDAGYSGIVLAVNISTLQLVRSSFPEEVLSLLSRYNVPSRSLELEITESAAMANPEVAMQTVRSLKLSHIGVSVDDFGTGYSSLSYLRKFDINRLKIDRSFIKEIALYTDDRSIVGAILDMAKHLGIEVIAEGVETWEQFEILSALQCRVMQGFLFSRSLSAEAADQLLSRMSRDPDWRLPEMPLLEH